MSKRSLETGVMQITGVSSSNRGQEVWIQGSGMPRVKHMLCSRSGSPLVILAPKGTQKKRKWSGIGFWVGRISCDLGRQKGPLHTRAAHAPSLLATEGVAAGTDFRLSGSNSSLGCAFFVCVSSTVSRQSDRFQPGEILSEIWKV